MSILVDARVALADAVSATGIQCSAYAPDTVVAPAAWIDSTTVNYQGGASFCESGAVEATIISVGQRNDRAGAAQMLDELQPDIIAALEAIDGVLVSQSQSGTTDVGGQTLPAVSYTVQFFITS